MTREQISRIRKLADEYREESKNLDRALLRNSSGRERLEIIKRRCAIKKRIEEERKGEGFRTLDVVGEQTRLQAFCRRSGNK